MINWYGKEIVLASKSERRKRLLKIIVNELTITSPNYREQNHEQLAPESLVQNHAQGKALSVVGNFKNAWIISADTIVVAENQILGKPNSYDEAFCMLKFLSGKKHDVYTGYCVLNSDTGKFILDYEKTTVRFRHLNDDLIKFYVDNYTPLDKAGSYGIQDFSAVFIEKIEGCYFNVVGFPIPRFFHTVKKELHKCL